jgi:hypothetical protein
MIVTVFKNIHVTDDPYFVDVVEIFKRIKDGNSKDLIEKIQQITEKPERNTLKKRLPSICFSGKFSKRDAGALLEHSGLICLDVDDLKSDDLSKIKSIATKDSYAHACFVSPSGNGVKIIVKITPGKANHKPQFLALEEHFNAKFKNFISEKKNEKQIGGKKVPIDTKQGEFLRVHIDKSGKDVGRVCYESYDADIFWNADSETWYECTEEVVEQKKLEDQNEIISLLQTWIDGQESYYDGNRNTYLTKFMYAMCRFGVNDFMAKDYLLKKFSDYPQSELEASLKSCYSKGDFNTQQFTEEQKNKKTARTVDIKIAKPVTAFWSINDKGRVKIDTTQFLDFVHAQGFAIYQQQRGDNKFHFVHIENMKVDIVSILQIKKVILDYVKKHAATPVFDELQMKNRYFENTFLNALPIIEVEQIRDTKDTSFIFFNDYYYEITANGPSKKDYIDLKGKHIWKSQICPQNITKVVDYKKHDFTQFVFNTMGKDAEKYKSACSALGYQIHTYKKRRLAKLMYACDGGVTELDGMASGGTGKNLFLECLKYVRSVVEIDGKDLDKRDKFKFQTISDDTQIVNIDDYEGDIKELFTKVTGHFEVEKKGLSKTSMAFEKSPKFSVSSNSSPKGFSDSFARRMYLIEFSDHYSAKHTPEDEFGEKDFFSPDDWNQNDWNCLYSFLFSCVASYLKGGLVEMKIDTNNYIWKTLVKNTGFEFAEFFKDFDVEEWFNGRELFDKFKEEAKTDYTHQQFYASIRKMCHINNWKYSDNGKKGNSKQVLIERGG